MKILLHTDLGHDPDDAIALAYLIENNAVPNIIGLSPGHLQQNEILTTIINSYDISYPKLYNSKDVEYNEKFSYGKHKDFSGNCLLPTEDLSELDLTVDRALIIGPHKNIGNKLSCNELFFQGGHCPKSIRPLEKFKNLHSVQSFNPSGAREDFKRIVDSENIKSKYFVGKNVCHGFTKAHLEKIWVPENQRVRAFFNKLDPTKAMHDVLAAILFIDKSKGIWINEKPVFEGLKMTTTPYQQMGETYIGSLTGIKF
ncbi:MAG TPA: hypothetical protein PKX31_00460 [Chitinophagaceae bacterium]|nr:hypothetical protein [Chitinophagaceae bacterium]